MIDFDWRREMLCMSADKLSDEEAEIVRRLANGEDPWDIDPEYGCTNPLTGYFPSTEVAAERARRRTAMPERAEIEAVAREMGGPAAWPMFLRAAEMAIEAVDRVRDARGDEALTTAKWKLIEIRSQAATALTAVEAALAPAARSPQGEDHDAGIEAMARAIDRTRDIAEDGLAAYLSRVSPSRDGTVAVDKKEEE
jgi:hypothetical protein